MRFGEILDAALAENLERQRHFGYIRDAVNEYAWLSEFCTVQLSYGRATGKTTAIMQRATSKDLVITHTWYTARELENTSIFNPKVEPASVLGVFDTRLAGLRFDRIWIDNASLSLDGMALGQLYELGVRTRAKQVILIG